MLALIFFCLFLRILHGHKLLELVVVIFPVHIMHPFGIIVVHVSLALIQIEVRFGHHALFVNFFVETVVFVIVLKTL